MYLINQSRHSFGSNNWTNDIFRNTTDLYNSSILLHNLTASSYDLTGPHVLSSLGTSLGCGAILLNIIFLCCMLHIRNKDSAYNRFIQNLTVCDILGSFTFIITQNWPQGPFAHILEEHQGNDWWLQTLPYVFRSLPWMFFTCYMLTLNCLSISQYLASCRPHVYVRIRMRKYIHYILLAVWIFSSLQVIIPTLVLVCLSVEPILVAFHKLIFISKVEMVGWMLVYMFSTCLSVVLNVIVYVKLRQLKYKHSDVQPRTSGANL